MPRVKGGPQTRQRRKKRLKLAKGQFRTATESVNKGQAYAYTGRKQRKRNFRQLWVTRINAAVRAHGVTYSQFMNGLKKANVLINRKMLSEMAIHDSQGFAHLVTLTQSERQPAAA